VGVAELFGDEWATLPGVADLERLLVDVDRDTGGCQFEVTAIVLDAERHRPRCQLTIRLTPEYSGQRTFQGDRECR
jgi:hypothetical protein